MTIKPTVGRVVHYWPSGDSMRAAGSQPQLALIAYVHSDSLVNLAAFDANGIGYSATSIPLYPGDGPRPTGAYCEWPVTSTFPNVRENPHTRPAGAQA